MQRLTGLAVLLAALLTASLAVASEQSKRFYSRGLVDFHAGRYSDALQLFERAVQADPNDPYALYYRGVTRGRLGDYTGAISDLRAALARKDDLDQARLELGVALVQAGKYEEAVPWLEQAQGVPTLEAQASLFLGMAQLRMGQTDVARRNFERAAERDPSLRLAARYYAGVADYRESNWERAREHFEYVVSTSPTSDMGHEAAGFLEDIRQGHGAPYEVYGTVGFAYDSNVNLAPTGQEIPLGVNSEADGSANLGVGFIYAPWRTEGAQLSLGYDFFQSLYFDLTDFNLQDHGPNAQLTMDAGFAQFGLLGRYDYDFLGGDSFLQEVTGLPWLTIPEGDFGSTQVNFRMRWRDFYDNPRIDGQQVFFSVLNGINLAPSIRQFFHLGLPSRYVFVGYQFDSQDQTNGGSEAFAYNGNQGEVGIGWLFPYAITAEASYAFHHEQYSSESGLQIDTTTTPPTVTSSPRRRDNEQQATVALHWQFSTHFGVTAAYYGTFNNSNKPAFEYNRQIGAVTLDARL